MHLNHFQEYKRVYRRQAKKIKLASNSLLLFSGFTQLFSRGILDLFRILKSERKKREIVKMYLEKQNPSTCFCQLSKGKTKALLVDMKG